MARSSGSGRSAGGLREIEEEPAETPSVAEEASGGEGEAKVYVAVGKEFKEGKATLIWALQNSSRESKIMIAHVHRPAQMIPFMGAKFAASQLTKAQVRAYRLIEKEKVDESLREYLDLCSAAKRRADKVVTEKDDIGKGLLEMISLHGINKLVMGAAADKQYSRKMKVPKSKTAITVQQQADMSCKIWFVCKGNLIFTRDSGLDDYDFAQSPASTLSPMSSQSEQLRSRSLPQRQAESLNWLLSPVQEILKRRSKSVSLDSPEGEIIALSPVAEHVTTSSTIAEVNAFDPWDSVSRTSRASDQSSFFASSDEALVNIGPVLPMLKDEENEEGLFILPLVHESDEDLQFSSTRHELEDVGMNDEVYEKLQHALTEIENLRHEAYEESCRRQKAERDSIEISRKARTSENLYTKELNRRKEIEETLVREMVELEKLKILRDEVVEELQKARDQESELKLRIAESDCVVRDLDEKLLAAHHLLNSLQQEREEWQLERENAVREVQELRQRRDEGTSDSGRATNFSEFSYIELEQATNMFDESMKIGEGGYGSVYKGFLRHTTVAIKMLNPQSMQGQSEFYQEVNVLSRVRHPHLVTLIGTCPESWALIYEYCANGSLEDRLHCKDNTAPLTWQVRTRIAAEICSALIFLHSNKPHSVVHGDLKTANILIDANFVSKLGDFGICRLLVQSNTSTLCCHTQPKGTFAYMDPEFLTSGDLTPGSDIYSFGVILLRLLTGRPALGLAKEVQEALNVGRLDQIIDPTAGNWPFVQANQLAYLALRCCEMKRNTRPDLVGEAWKVLEPMSKAASPAGLSSFTFGSAPDDNSCIPSYFLCPIFQEIMRDPHIAADGFTYESEALKGWLDSGHDTSPMTNIKLPHHQLIPNRALRSAIQEWLQQYT